ncbi:MAG TPA: TonB-dependent receptor [Thermoanaerobaculia bacterium]|nr:TonB-dependent receptor [Thermoanaerobaculia bacterium]
MKLARTDRCARALLALALFSTAARGEAPPPGAPVVTEELTVTATRTERRLGDTAASVAVLSPADLQATAAPTVDDALRQVPGFSLFRRSGSRFANPTAQGISLRGLGGSGASRAVVLADGIPLNDPFGGWVYWGRVPRASLARIEVLRGAASDLYGSGALSGTVQLLTREAGRPGFLAAEASGGDRRSADGSLYLGGRGTAWGASLAAERSTTAGYVPVDPAVRGPVDTPVASQYTTADLALERWTAGGARLFVRGSRFAESRENGTPLQTNDTAVRQWSAGGDWAADRGSLTFRAYGGNQDLHQGFSAVAADRASERLTRLQEVPADSFGLLTQGSLAFGGNAVVAGMEVRQVSGASRETVFTGSTTQRVAGEGRQRTAGAYIEDIWSAFTRLTVTLGARFDAWRNEDARQIAGAKVTPLSNRGEQALSPRATLLYRVTDRLTWTASAYRAFRAPTLNELYRTFRVGDVVTQANSDLKAERLSGVESGGLWTSGLGRVTARGTLFWMDMDRTVANVTLSTVSGLITRKRDNLGRTRSRGIEAEATARAGDRWTLTGGYLLSDAQVVSFPRNRALEGLDLPQVPRHQATFQARYQAFQGGTLGIQARWTGRQFDDDQNRLPLRSFMTVDLLAAYPLGGGIAAFFAAENLFDQRYETGRTPLRTLGPPRLVRVGVRVERGR